MIISERQIMALINNSSALVARMIATGTDSRIIDEVVGLLTAIEKQQSEKLIDINYEPFDPKDYE